MHETAFQYRRPLLRIGSITFLIGLAIFIISSAFHAGREDPANHLRVFTVLRLYYVCAFIGTMHSFNSCV